MPVLRALVVVLLSGISFYGGVAAQNLSVRWTIVHDALNEKGQVLQLGDSIQFIQLRGDWTCSVGATLKRPSHEARTTVCSNGKGSFEFSAQCEPARRHDEIQVRFHHPSQARFADFLGVACQLLNAESATSLTRGVYTLYRTSVILSQARVHVATFDAMDGESYNAKNCQNAAALFGEQPGVLVRYWCEAGVFRE
jgi:hypothetical protein